jgi:hypothetical protein
VHWAGEDDLWIKRDDLTGPAAVATRYTSWNGWLVRRWPKAQRRGDERSAAEQHARLTAAVGARLGRRRLVLAGEPSASSQATSLDGISGASVVASAI